MSTLTFYFWLLVGTITPTGNHEGYNTYSLKLNNNEVVEYAYKNEIINYIETDHFEYDETLEFDNINTEINE